MGRSLVWQILWPFAVLLAAGLCAAGLDHLGRREAAARVAAVLAMRESLDRANAQLVDRHVRTVRRVREALLEPRPQNRVAMLSWTSEHYVREMEQFVTEAHALVRDIELPGADRRLERDLERLSKQLGLLTERAQAIAAALDTLLSAVSAEDPQATAAAVQDLDIADSSMQALFVLTQSTVQRATSWQARHVGRQGAEVPAAWALVGLWGIAALLLAARPLRRLTALAEGRTAPGGAVSSAERAVAERLTGLHDEVARATAQLAERTRELERATAAARRSEHELALSRIYNDNLTGSLRSAVVATNATGIVTSLNRPARDVLGIDDSAVGAPITELALATAFATRGAYQPRSRRESVPYPHPTRGEILLDITVAPYLDESGAARGDVWIADDVTDAVHLKNQLLAAEHLAAVGRLSAQVAHEIRNPLSAIGLNAELLEEELAPLEPARRKEATALLRGIASEIERLTDITEGYLTLARLPRPALRDVDLNQLVSDLFAMLGEEMRSHRITVRLDLATPAPRAWVDPGQLRQAVLNIVTNSRDAMHEGGTLRVATASSGAESSVEVTDDGAGIPPDVLPRVFEPFYTTKPNGTGLGLSLTEQIIHEHGGGIEIAPVTPRGTRVLLKLPARSPDAQIQAPSAKMAALTPD